MRDEGKLLVTSFWSALTGQRFGPSRPVATMSRLNQGKDFGVRPPKEKAVTGHRIPWSCALVLLIAVLSFACTTNRGAQSIPPEVEATITTLSEEIAAERYDKIYHEASELFRQDATIEQSAASFKTLRTKLGTVESRMPRSAIEQQNSSGPLTGRAYIITYRTKFQNAEGMETFTLVERAGRWQLARYFVNSTALK